MCTTEATTNDQGVAVGGRNCLLYSDFMTVTMVVVKHSLAPTAVAPSVTPLREGMDTLLGVTITLGGTDPEGSIVTPAIVRPPGDGSCGDTSTGDCGTLYQVNAGGTPGAAFSAEACNHSVPCYVTDPAHRVIFIPPAAGRDGSGPTGPAYCTIQFAVADDGALLSTAVDVPIRINAAPSVPANARRVGQCRLTPSRT